MVTYPGAQTERRGGARPVRGLLGGKASPAALIHCRWSKCAAWCVAHLLFRTIRGTFLNLADYSYLSAEIGRITDDQLTDRRKRIASPCTRGQRQCPPAHT